MICLKKMFICKSYIFGKTGLFMLFNIIPIDIGSIYHAVYDILPVLYKCAAEITQGPSISFLSGH